MSIFCGFAKSVLPSSVKQREKRFRWWRRYDDNVVTAFVGPSVVMHLLFLVDLSWGGGLLFLELFHMLTSVDIYKCYILYTSLPLTLTACIIDRWLHFVTGHLKNTHSLVHLWNIINFCASFGAARCQESISSYVISISIMPIRKATIPTSKAIRRQEHIFSFFLRCSLGFPGY